MSETKQRSERIDALLAKHGTPSPVELRAAAYPCEGTKFHSPSPLVTVSFQAWEGRQIWLCPNCMSKLSCFIHLHETEPAALTWDVMREFGNQIRLFGQEIIRRRAAPERNPDA